MFNVTRSPTAPACLSNKQYNTPEVVALLQAMFFGKCYLCEQDELDAPEIEHFDPHKGDETKKYAWDNLFYACARCNSIKSHTHKNLLNCCDPNVDVFRAIKCIMPSIPDHPIQITAMINPQTDEAINTEILLNKCYNESETGLRDISRISLIERIFDYYSKFLAHRQMLKDKESTAQERTVAKERFQAMLKVEFPFSNFWRWHVLDDAYLCRELSEFIDF